MKVLIIEEALKTLHGHWFQYISDIVNGGREAGHEIEVAVHKDACTEILSTLPCRPILGANAFEPNGSSGGMLGTIKRVIAHNRSVYRDLRKLLSQGNPYDAIIATTPRIEHVPALELLYWRFRRPGQQWVLIFVEAAWDYSEDYSQIRVAKKSWPLKFAMKLSRLLPDRSRFSLVTESEGLARQFERFSGLKFPLVPHVTRLPDLAPYRVEVNGSLGRPINLGTYGFTRYDKGLDVLQAAIQLLPVHGVRPKAHFIIQWTGDYRLPDGSWVRKEPTLEASPYVRYIPPFTASEEYYKWVAQTDVMVLPYRKAFYHDKLSRVAIDAALAGMPIVYPEGTWLELFVKEHAAGVAFQAEKPASLAKAIQEATERYSELKTEVKTRMSSCSAAFSARTFFDIITALAATK